MKDTGFTDFLRIPLCASLASSKACETLASSLPYLSSAFCSFLNDDLIKIPSLFQTRFGLFFYDLDQDMVKFQFFLHKMLFPCGIAIFALLFCGCGETGNATDLGSVAARHGVRVLHPHQLLKAVTIAKPLNQPLGFLF